MPSHSPKQQGTAYPTTHHTQSIADLVLDPHAYTALLAAQAKQSEEIHAHPPSSSPHNDVPHASPHNHPSTSIADLVLNNVTYDKILSSSAKGLHLSAREFPPSDTPPLGDDARTPPNSPTNEPTNQSLMAASSTIMASDSVTRPGADGVAS